MPRRNAQKTVGRPQALSRGEETLALHLRCYGLLAERQYHFCPTRKWAADFAWPDLKLIAEVDGAVHRIKERFKADIERHNWLALNGWRHLRFSTRMVESGEAIDLLRTLLGGDVRRG